MSELDEKEISAEVVEKLGYLLMLSRHVGSKSERAFPCLISDEACSVWLRYNDDDSFTHATLRQYHLSRVKVKGLFTKKGQLIVETISKIEDPIVKM